MDMDASLPRIIRLLAAWALADSSLTACAAGGSKRPADDPANFEGVWTARQCDARALVRECGVFTLYLTQDGERISGEHSVATPGLAKLEESDPGSVLGTHAGNKAFLFVANSRTGSKELAVVERVASDLKWHVVGPVVLGERLWNNIIPEKKSLHHNSEAYASKELLELKKNCLWPDTRTQE